MSAAVNDFARRRGPIPVPVGDRFWHRVSMGAESDCWPWMDRLDPDGYGLIWGNSHNLRAHRVAYELLVGAIPAGLVIDHLCRNRRCVNPTHMEAVTPAENTRRGDAARVQKTGICLHGHAMTPSNTYRRPDNPSQGACRTCRNDACRRYAQRRAEVKVWQGVTSTDEQVAS